MFSGRTAFSAYDRRGGLPALSFALAAGAGATSTIIGMLALEPLLVRRPEHAVGGERQRVAIGRALLSDPDLLVMDEPLAALDDARKAEIIPWLERLRDEIRPPILYVSHSVPEVLRAGQYGRADAPGRVTRGRWPISCRSRPRARTGAREAGALIRARVACAGARQAGAGRDLGRDHAAARAGPRWAANYACRSLRMGDPVARGAAWPFCLNVLPVRVIRLHGGLVQLALGDERMLAQITPRSVKALDLQARNGLPRHS